MNVGVCRIELRMPENQSLKAKRQIVKSMSARLRSKYNVSVAEVDNHGLWQLATLGLSCVSNYRRHADETLYAALKFIVQNYPGVEVVSSETETFPAF